MRHDDEEDVDELGARDHLQKVRAIGFVRKSMSESDSQLSPAAQARVRK